MYNVNVLARLRNWQSSWGLQAAMDYGKSRDMCLGLEPVSRRIFNVLFLVLVMNPDVLVLVQVSRLHHYKQPVHPPYLHQGSQLALLFLS